MINGKQDPLDNNKQEDLSVNSQPPREGFSVCGGPGLNLSGQIPVGLGGQDEIFTM